ncbi:hypothetical protein [Actinomyces viscosus]|uniref:hypothetical protein n=1 Tax=Actinomyces viscosus TaxID=1656 RepID=UPI0028E6C954|nr:hypothetical protein [Actinomyces viscosus]
MSAEDPSKILVHPRVTRKHPDLTERDVLAAWQHTIEFIHRADTDQWVAIGPAPDGRMVEMVAVHGSNGWLIYHAMTPPTRKTTSEIRAARRRTR